MPELKKLDPFRPAQPQIPGVEAVSAKQEAPPPAPIETAAELAPRRKSPKWIVGVVAAALVLGAALAWWTHISSSRSESQDTEEATPTPEAGTTTQQPAVVQPVGPGTIATTDELAKPWSSKRFLYRNPLTDETVPALVVHLPGGKYWGFSLREPYGKCEMELVTDLQKLQSTYSVKAGYPMVGDPCDKSVFDLTRYTNAPGGLVRGEVVTGPAIRPPVAIEISTRGDKVLAERME